MPNSASISFLKWCLIWWLYSVIFIYAQNELCLNNSWNIIKGNWDFDMTNCILQNIDSGDGNKVWFGSSNGLTYDSNYDATAFTVKVSITIHSGIGNAGIIFHATQSSVVNDAGPNLYVGISTNYDSVIFGYSQNGIWHESHNVDFTINYNASYELILTASESVYNVYINSVLVLENIIETQLRTGTIGIRTYQAPSTFSSLTFEKQNKISSYFAGPSILSWTDAENYCKSIGTQLASIHSVHDFNAARLKCKETSAECWFGLSDIENEAVYIWSDNSTSDFGFSNNDPANITAGILPWGSQEPNNCCGGENCIHFQSPNYYFNDGFCSNQYYPLCKYEKSFGFVPRTLSAEADGKTLLISCPNGQVISVIEASYGMNCNTMLYNNQLNKLRSECEGQPTCKYTIQTSVIGDPAFGCAKEYHYEYECNGYELILNLKDATQGLFSADLKNYGLENQNNPTANSYSVIGLFDAIKQQQYRDTTDKYSFELIFKYSDGRIDVLKWKQESWITNSTITGADLYNIPGDACADDCNFEGLGLSTNGCSYLDGDGRSNVNWYNAVGSNCYFNGGVPAFNGQTAISQSLYILNPYIDIPTPRPTTDPTFNPTYIPTNQPTSNPTTNPTNDPTSQPTIEPTTEPTFNPTTEPTTEPTLTPTKSPSFTPTIPPSIAPTNNPSLAPTFIPSKAPTLPPSKAPTSPPSVFPTTAPSYSPTACIDANQNISSVDGYEENINDKIFNLHFNNTLDVNKKIISDKPGQFYGYKFSNLSNDNKQELICSDISSCLMSTIIFENSSICNLKCNETLACSNSIVNMTECAKTHIICNGIDACNSMYVSISTNNNYEIDIQCGMKSSCNDMVIDMTGNGLSNIQCFDLNACDGLQIYIEPKYYKNNYLHLFSHSNDVLFSNGFGYEEVDGSQQYIKCNTKDQFIRWNDSVIYTNELLEPLILNEYTNNLFPCSGVTVECFQPNNTNNTNNTIEISDCVMNFAADISDFNITSISPNALCYWVSVIELARISCTGSCVTSPTYSPTPSPTDIPTYPTNNPTNTPSLSPTITPSITPTFSPSITPSFSPTINPSIAPSFAPSISPSITPSISPTQSPTISPTISPSIVPSISPTLNPSITPTFSPSISPSLTPTLFPSISPSQPPTFSPTISPSISPSNIPTNSPSISPTYSPSISPSNIPTDEPTASPSDTPTQPPTLSPSQAPSAAPTQFPTWKNQYNSYIEAFFEIKYLTEFNIIRIASAVFDITNDIAFMVEQGFDNDLYLEYRDLSVNISNINNYAVEHLNENPNADQLLRGSDILELKSFIKCEEINCRYISDNNYDKLLFEKFITHKLRIYFGNRSPANSGDESTSLVEFRIKSLSDTMELFPILANIDYVFYVLVSVTGSMIIVAFIALLFNKRLFPKLPGLNIVDDGKWMAIVIFALQFWDFTSDVNLSFEIWTQGNLEDMLTFIAAVGSTGFVLIPYVANLIMAINIKNIVRNNETAKTYFQHNTALFCLLVVLVGGCYPSLALVSSNIFGLKIMSSGITQYELNKLSKIKVFGTVILENCPQLIFQALYAYAINEITDAVGIAFFASALSVLASTLSYLIDRAGDDIQAVEYYLSIQCVRQSKPNDVSNTEQTISTKPYTTHKNTEHVKTVKSKSIALEMSNNNININDITEEEKQQIINNKGRTQALGEALAALCEIQPKNIEIGSTVITTHGAVTHVVHFVYKTEIELMQNALYENDNIVDDNIIVTPKFYTNQLYASHMKQVTQIFRNHFGLSNDFKVIYQDLIGRKRPATMMKMKNDDYKSRNNVLQKMVTHAKLNLNENGDGKYIELKSALTKYLLNNDNDDRLNIKSDLQQILQILDDENDIKQNKLNELKIEATNNEGHGIELEMTTLVFEASEKREDMINELVKAGDIEFQTSVKL